MSAWPAFNSIHWLAGTVLLVLLAYCLRQRERRVSIPLASFIGFTAAWCVCAALIGVASDLETKILVNRVKMVAVALVPLSTCYLAASLNTTLTIQRWVWGLALIVPVTSAVLSLSPAHDLLITGYALEVLPDGILFTYANGPWFQIHSLVARCLILGGVFVMWQGMKHMHPFHRVRNKLIIASILFPALIDTVAVYFFPELRYIQVVPTALAFSSLVLVYTVFAQRALEVIPFARAKIIDQMPDPCLMWDLRGKLLDFNPAAQRYFHLSEHQIGTHVEAIRELPLELRASYPWAAPLELEVAETCFFAEGRPVQDNRGFVLGATLLLKNISGQKRLERELRGLNQVKTTFMGILAHDLVGNVASIANTSEVLVREHHKMAQEDVHANLESISAGARDVNQFILQLADWARTQHQTLRVEKTSLDLHSTTQKIVEYLRPLAVEKELNILVRIPPGTRVPADPRMIETVLRNLLANSIKFGPKGSDIQLSTTDSGDVLKFSITDQGTSLDPVRLNAFFQDTTAEVSTSSFGTQGLGLLLCRGFIQLHRGNIWAEKLRDGTSAIHFHLQKDHA